MINLIYQANVSDEKAYERFRIERHVSIEVLSSIGENRKDEKMSRRSKGKWGFLFNAIVIMLILTVYHMYTYFRDKAWNIESIKVSIVMVLAYILIGFVVQLVVNRRNRTEPGVLLDALVLVLLMGFTM